MTQAIIETRRHRADHLHSTLGLKTAFRFFKSWTDSKTTPAPVTPGHERIQMLKSSSIKRTSAAGKIATFRKRELVTVYLESVNIIVVCVCECCLRRKAKKGHGGAGLVEDMLLQSDINLSE